MIPFGAWMGLAARIYGIAPADFWRLSLREWRWLIEVETGPAPMTREALSALQARYPDGGSRHGQG